MCECVCVFDTKTDKNQVTEEKDIKNPQKKITYVRFKLNLSGNHIKCE